MLRRELDPRAGARVARVVHPIHQPRILFPPEDVAEEQSLVGAQSGYIGVLPGGIHQAACQVEGRLAHRNGQEVTKPPLVSGAMGQSKSFR